MNNITVANLLRIAPSVPLVRINDIVNGLNSICPQYGINEPNIMHEFLANVLEECIEFTRLEENMNYSADRLMQVWPTRFPDLPSTMHYTHNPQMLANKVYGGRLGNVQTNDGWDFRGSGPMQSTGRTNAETFAKYMTTRFQNTQDAAEWMALLRTDIASGMHNASWIFAIAKKLIPLALADDLKGIVWRINGGFTGFPQRLRYYNLCKQYIV